MIKPDAMRKGYAGGILDMMINGGFRVVALKQLRLTPEKAGEFYAVHIERPFYGELVEFMSSGPIIAAILEKENAVAPIVDSSVSFSAGAIYSTIGDLYLWHKALQTNMILSKEQQEMS